MVSNLGEDLERVFKPIFEPASSQEDADRSRLRFLVMHLCETKCAVASVQNYL